jgi:glyceraldehyde-3-phosphate dehydrogenase (NADP+)
VILCIPPFNYPVNLAVSKLAPALMAGNTVVLKPPSQGVVAGVHMLQCFHKAGIPAGVVNMVSGEGLRGFDALESKGLGAFMDCSRMLGL